MIATVEITKDHIGTMGRSIEISVIKTDNVIFNSKVPLPITLSKTFAIETPSKKIIDWATKEAISAIKYANKRIKDPKNIVGSQIKVEV